MPGVVLCPFGRITAVRPPDRDDALLPVGARNARPAPHVADR